MEIILTPPPKEIILTPPRLKNLSWHLPRPRKYSGTSPTPETILTPPPPRNYPGTSPSLEIILNWNTHLNVSTVIQI